MSFVSVLKRLWPVLLCLGYLSCQSEGNWTRGRSDCNPTKSESLRQSKRWNTTFGAKGAPACLRVSWGSRPEESVGLYAFLDNKGSLKAYSTTSGLFDADFSYEVPLESREKERSFQLFVFGDSVNTDTQQEHCKAQMGKANYRCVADEKGSCWFSMEFQPNADGSGIKAKNVPGGCRLHLPEKSISEEPQPSEIADAQEFHSPQEPSLPEKPEALPEKTPEEMSTPELEPQPEPEPKEEPRPLDEPSVPEEKTPEPTPEPVREIVPEITNPPSSPTLWAKRAGSGNEEISRDIAIDKAGNVIITGYFGGNADFGTTKLSAKSLYDIFVAKLDKSGKWLWAKSAGGFLKDEGHGVAVDSTGNIYVVGEYEIQADFGTLKLTTSGGTNAFIAKMDGNGKWLWVKQVGDSGDDLAYGVVVDKTNQIFVTGIFEDIVSFGKTKLNSGSNVNGFVGRMDSSGNWLWAKRIFGAGGSAGNAVAVDSQANVLCIGDFKGQGTFGTTKITAKGGNDIFITKLDMNGKWLWTQSAGGSSEDRGRDVVVDKASGVIIVGQYSGESTFGTKKLKNKGPKGTTDIFISKLSKDGKWIWSTSAGGVGQDAALGVTVDKVMNISVTGRFSTQSDFGSSRLKSKGNLDIFVARMDAAGKWLWAKSAGGTEEDQGRAIIANSTMNLHVTGFFKKQSFFDTTKLTSNGEYEAFIWTIK